VFLHSDACIEALVALLGVALLVFALIEAELRLALGEGVALEAILSEGRSAKPTARAVHTGFDGLSVTYTARGLVLDRLTKVQRVILAHLGISSVARGGGRLTLTVRKPDLAAVKALEGLLRGSLEAAAQLGEEDLDPVPAPGSIRASLLAVGR